MVSPRHQCRVLVIEDDRSIGPLVELVLERDGLETVVVESGEKGLALLREETFTVVVLDLMMSGVNGWDILHRIARDRLTLSVIVATAVSPKQRGDLDPSIVKAVIDKPFDIKELAKAVKLCCHGKTQ